MITLGGNAELELVDSMDPFSEGIIFSVMPPKKSWKNISNLSGGEKTLSSLALVFALHVYKVSDLTRSLLSLINDHIANTIVLHG
jgi:structural maintenance of chromosome 4